MKKLCPLVFKRPHEQNQLPLMRAHDKPRDKHVSCRPKPLRNVRLGHDSYPCRGKGNENKHVHAWQIHNQAGPPMHPLCSMRFKYFCEVPEQLFCIKMTFCLATFVLRHGRREGRSMPSSPPRKARENAKTYLQPN